MHQLGLGQPAGLRSALLCLCRSACGSYLLQTRPFARQNLPLTGSGLLLLSQVRSRILLEEERAAHRQDLPPNQRST